MKHIFVYINVEGLISFSSRFKLSNCPWPRYTPVVSPLVEGRVLDEHPAELVSDSRVRVLLHDVEQVVKVVEPSFQSHIVDQTFQRSQSKLKICIGRKLNRPKLFNPVSPLLINTWVENSHYSGGSIAGIYCFLYKC